MKKFILKVAKPFAFLAVIATITVSCNDDYLNVESDIRGVQNFGTDSKVFPFVAYTKKTDPVQSNDLPDNLLGVYNDPNFGTSTASIITQILPTDLTPDFGETPAIQSVKLYIPFYSNLESTDSETGASTYTLDSVYGNIDTPYKLSIYRSDYLLRDLDPATDFEEKQIYYSNIFQTIDVDTQTSALLYEDENFTPSAAENTTTELDDNGDPQVTNRFAPGIWVDLTNSDYGIQEWEDLLFLNEDNEVLSNRSSFYEFFRGLIFKVESTSDDGAMVMLNLDDSDARITVEYTYDDPDNDDPLVTLDGTYSFSFTGIHVNNFENLNTIIPTGNETLGDNNLYLKGLDGNMSIIKLFDGTVLDENGNNVDALEYFKSKKDKWLLNEADLTFYVNQSSSLTNEPERVVLYDLKNNSPIIDYFYDGSDNFTTPVNSKIIYSNRLERDENNNGVRYKIRLTEHLNNILLRDSTNVELGLYVSTNVNNISESTILNTTEDDVLNMVPKTSVLSPEGTVLYGNTAAVPADKKATFEIYYTEPEN